MTDLAPLKSEWETLRRRLRDELGEATYNSWISGLDVAGFEGGVLTLEAPNRFARDKVLDRFGDLLTRLWRETDPLVESLHLAVAGEAARSEAPPLRLAAAGGGGIAAPTPPPAGYGTTTVNLDPRLQFDAFVVGGSNELAHAAARRVAEATEVHGAYNPLFLYGGVGLGKTHLMQAIAWEAQRRGDRKVLFVSAEKFMHRFVSAVRYKDTMAFKDEFRSVDILLIDDFQFIAGKESTQEEFFHTFNALIDRRRQVVVSADCSPTDLEGVEERIKSRLNWGLVADVGAPDYELRLGVLQTKLEEARAAFRGLSIEGDVLPFIAERVTSNMRMLEGALNRLVAHATCFGVTVDLPMAEDLLKDLVRSFERRVTIEEIQRRVAEDFNIKLSDLLSPRRARAVARPRQIAMWLCKELTEASLPEIGRKFAGRDHTTIMHGVRRINELSEADPAFRTEVMRLHRALGG